jgi:hypothetical protein
MSLEFAEIQSMVMALVSAARQDDLERLNCGTAGLQFRSELQALHCAYRHDWRPITYARENYE